MKIRRPLSATPRENLSWEERWKGDDQGLIACWERGRQKATEDPALATLAKQGQLVPLPWKGGVERATKEGKRYGTLNYLAMWQGLRGESLDIDDGAEFEVTCSATGMTVVFTANASKLEQT